MQDAIRKEFRLKEYDALQEKMSYVRSDVSRLETVYPLAIVSVYVWIFANPPEAPFLWQLVLALPFLIAILGITRLYSRRKHMTLLERYVRAIELEIYGSESGLGWEGSYAKERPLKLLVWFRGAMALGVLMATGWIACSSDNLFHQLPRTTSQDLQHKVGRP